LGLVVPLGAEIIEQDRLVDLGKGARGVGEPPAGEVEEIVGISAHRVQRKAARPLRVQELIEEWDLAALLVGDPIRRDAGG
jgi:hypothetical protein